MENNTKYALITGATSGIGYELALLFAKNGYNLIIVSRDLAELQNKAVEFKDCGVDVKTIQSDLFDLDSAFAVCEKADALGVDIEVLVNDAGQGLYGEFKDTDIRRELDIINLNISSLVILTKYFIKKLPGATDTDFFNKADMLDSKIVQDKDALSDPKDVAQDGYDALMADDDKVVSGIKNKVSATLANITPDSKLAKQFGEMQKPVDED